MKKLEKFRKTVQKENIEKYQKGQEHLQIVLQTRKDKLQQEAALVKDKIENPQKYYKPVKAKTQKLDAESQSSRSEELQRQETLPKEAAKEAKEVPVFVQRPKSAKTVRGVAAHRYLSHVSTTGHQAADLARNDSLGRLLAKTNHDDPAWIEHSIRKNQEK